MNRELRPIMKVFKNAVVTSVRHTGVNIPRGTVRLDAKELPAVIRSLSTSGTGAVVSTLENGDARYLAIVNRDPNDNMTVEIEVDSAVQRILKDGSAVNAGSGNVSVKPGDILIYAWNN
jgi:hypothetical protein